MDTSGRCWHKKGPMAEEGKISFPAFSMSSSGQSASAAFLFHCTIRNNNTESADNKLGPIKHTSIWSTTPWWTINRGGGSSGNLGSSDREGAGNRWIHCTPYCSTSIAGTPWWRIWWKHWKVYSISEGAIGIYSTQQTLPCCPKRRTLSQPRTTDL